MAYQVIEPLVSKSDVKPLGVALNGLKPIYLTNDQAFENLKTLLLTRKGERYIQPTFGTDLLNILFEPNLNLIKQGVSDIIKDPVSKWLPYINIENIDITTAEDDPTLTYEIRIRISFSVEQYSTQTITFTVDNSGTLEVA